MALEWKGKEVEDRLVKALIGGVDETMSCASIHAKNHHPWSNRTGILEGSIRPIVQAHEQGGNVVGIWGSVDVKYAVYLELGTVKMRAFPYLRPAADVEYANLKERIRKRFEKKGGE